MLAWLRRMFGAKNEAPERSSDLHSAETAAPLDLPQANSLPDHKPAAPTEARNGHCCLSPASTSIEHAPGAEPSALIAPTPAPLPAIATARGTNPAISVAPPAIPIWRSRIPRQVFFIDVETTGLGSEDRIVSFAGVLLNTEEIGSRVNLKLIHAVFDPGRKSHPAAEAIHGYDDWTLRHQEFFSERATEIRGLFDAADLVVAHNAEFDLRFVNREFEALGHAPINKPVYCTMNGYRQMYPRGRASLDAVIPRVGLARSSVRHGALEDAWLAMMVYMWLHDCPFRAPFSVVDRPEPLNFKAAPPRPEGKLPQRKRRPSRTQISTGPNQTPNTQSPLERSNA